MSLTKPQAEWLMRVLDMGLVGPDGTPLGTEPDTEPGAPLAATEAPIVAPGTVAYRTALLEFRRARQGVGAQIRTLARSIAADLPEEADLAEAVATEIDDFCDTLDDTIDAGLNALADTRPARHAQLKREVLALIDTVGRHRLIAHLDQNPVETLTVARTLTAALTRVAATIPA